MQSSASHISVGKLAQKRNGRRLGSVSMLSECSWVVWSAGDGHHLQVPLRADVVHRNARFLSHLDTRALKGIGQTGKTNKIIEQKVKPDTIKVQLKSSRNPLKSCVSRGTRRTPTVLKR